MEIYVNCCLIFRITLMWCFHSLCKEIKDTRMYEINDILLYNDLDLDRSLIEVDMPP